MVNQHLDTKTTSASLNDGPRDVLINEPVVAKKSFLDSTTTDTSVMPVAAICGKATRCLAD